MMRQLMRERSWLIDAREHNFCYNYDVTDFQ